MLSNAHLPIVGIAAWSGTGKTTLLKELLPLLGARGLRVGVVKHAHHSFEVDYPGKDSYELRKSGAAQMLIASRSRWALVVEQERGREPRLDEVLLELDQGALDLILVEGFKEEAFPKIELHRPSLGYPLLFRDDKAIVAVATDAPLEDTGDLPQLDLNSPADIAAFIFHHVTRGHPSDGQAHDTRERAPRSDSARGATTKP
ncbi:MAG: molybdopterin-guanine dinucleotide biosynthesis protein B [Gammaproteobacteria bacterium]|nr:molybdopterin-guanine dinucleotide biosynthesis protein B [Gammaproteobacteria bacterium]NIM74556.1 molybdopterin-guanine dinucleotide biosynthesis protein B [Gammaproteobacteria bacterium]NIO26389.1 molybdopterin-guanine dinucleotide biosynthesis protein B [Gammaproteobacteria bacterium]NIO66941.1 molybdopterin-guanine dinucleotide biosynthesis protein B [Gammaproteobacteria bacterium]NIP44951.1 molybdopterin-guanine dinucleotide biosynthesis protein B [Gammaproteobacteria bacterium]